jgi:GTP cyclohydrolase I
MNLREFTGIFNSIVPPVLAEEWDNSGLQSGKMGKAIRKVLLAVDCSEETVDEALASGADLLLTHHPLIFKPLRHITDNDSQGRVLQKLISRNLPLLSAHTNLDILYYDTLGRHFGLSGIRPLSERKSLGLGCYGRIKQRLNFGEFTDLIRKKLKLKNFRTVGDKNLQIRKVAFCGGAGRDLINESLTALGIDVIVTSDLGYHDALRARSLGLAAVDAGHFHTEKVLLPRLAVELRKKFKNRVSFTVSRIDTTPFNEERTHDG